MIVIDASAMAEMLIASDVGQRVSERILTARRRHAPHLLDIEVTSTLRRLVLNGRMKAPQMLSAIEDLRAFPMRKHGHAALLDRVFELRSNLSAYDAVYVALAEALGTSLVTCDAALVGAPGRRAEVELFT